MSSLTIRVTPRASADRIVVDDHGLVRVYVTAPPVDGQANTAVVELIAKRLGVAKSKITIVKGEASREKTLSIEGVTAQEANERLQDQGKLL